MVLVRHWVSDCSGIRRIVLRLSDWYVLHSENVWSPNCGGSVSDCSVPVSFVPAVSEEQNAWRQSECRRKGKIKTGFGGVRWEQ